MRYVLRLGPREFELLRGRFVIGRAEGCQLALDDPLVSRTHAALVVSEEGVVLEDLGSRNGVSVNGERVSGTRPLVPNDVLTVGKSELVLALRREFAAETLAQMPTQRLPPFGLIGMLAEKALALGRGDEAERLMGAQIDQVVSDAENGRRVDLASAERAAEYALRIATSTGNAERANSMLRLYAALRRPCSTSMVEELHAVLRKARLPRLEALRNYVAVLKELELGPAERFVASRLEGLARSLS